MKKMVIALVATLAVMQSGAAFAATGSWTASVVPPDATTSPTTTQTTLIPPSNVPTNAVITGVTYTTKGYNEFFGAKESIQLCYVLPTGVSYGSCQAASKSGGSYGAPVGQSARSRFRFLHNWTGYTPATSGTPDTVTVTYRY